MTKQATENSEVSMRILKTAVCPSLSGKSKLTYEIGCTGAKDVQLRLVGNTNAGCWNSDWVSLKAIQAAFDKVPAGEPVTSDTLRKIFVGKSANSGGFALAVLKHVGYVVLSTTKKRCYDRVEPTAFREELAALIEGRPTDVKTKKNAGKKAAPTKTPSGPTKKTK